MLLQTDHKPAHSANGDRNVNRSWGVLIAKHHEHKRVQDGLTANGVDHFIPTVDDETFIHGRRVRHERLLLGSYVLFVVDEFWKSIQTMRGVARVILTLPDYKSLKDVEEFKASPVLIDVKQMKAFREFVDRPPVVKSTGGFFYGQRVMPVSNTHAFAFHVGRFDGQGRKGKLAALFQLFGQDVRVLFNSGELVSA